MYSYIFIVRLSDRMLGVVILRVVILRVVILRVVILSVIMLSAVGNFVFVATVTASYLT